MQGLRGQGRGLYVVEIIPPLKCFIHKPTKSDSTCCGIEPHTGMTGHAVKDRSRDMTVGGWVGGREGRGGKECWEGEGRTWRKEVREHLGGREGAEERGRGGGGG